MPFQTISQEFITAKPTEKKSAQNSYYPEDYYKFLHVDPTASPQAIDAAYHQLQKIYSSTADTSEPALDLLIRLNQIYACLRDPLTRRQYDMGLFTTETTGGPTLSGQQEDLYGITKAVYVRYLFIGCITAIFCALTLTTASSVKNSFVSADGSADSGLLYPSQGAMVTHESQLPSIAPILQAQNVPVQAQVMEGALLNTTLEERTDVHDVQGVQSTLAISSRPKVKTLGEISAQYNIQLMPASEDNRKAIFAPQIPK